MDPAPHVHTLILKAKPYVSVLVASHGDMDVVDVMDGLDTVR